MLTWSYPIPLPSSPSRHGRVSHRGRHGGCVVVAQIDLPLAAQLRFHSLFVCPITREACGDGNPPVLLTCGHVISKAAVTGLLDRRSGDRLGAGCVCVSGVLDTCLGAAGTMVMSNE